MLKDVFIASLAGYLVFSIIEAYSPGFISYYFSVDVFLLASLASGVMHFVWLRLKSN